MVDKELTILDDLKKVEETIKKRLLAKCLKSLKELAKNVLELKFEMQTTLEILGLDEKEQKQVIDWINSLPDTGIKEEEKKKIKQDVERKILSEKKEVEKKVSDNYDVEQFRHAVNMNHSTNSRGSNNGLLKGGAVTYTNPNMVLCSNSLEVGGMSFKSIEGEITPL